MIFAFECQKCHKRIEQEYSIGKAPRTVPCPCGDPAKRIYEATGLVFMVGGKPMRKSTWGEDQKKKNERAAFRMQGKKPPVRLLGYDKIK